MGATPIRCLVDIDGVVADWLPSFRGHIMRRGVGANTLPDPKTYDFHDLWGLRRCEFEAELLLFGEDGGWAKPSVWGDGREMVDELLEAGCWVGLATLRARTEQTVADTLEWVGRHRLAVDSVGIGLAAKFDVDVDFVFDDCPAVIRVLDEVGECLPLLIDRPWNRLEDLPRVRADEVAPLVAAMDRTVDLTDLHPTDRLPAMRDALIDLRLA